MVLGPGLADGLVGRDGREECDRAGVCADRQRNACGIRISDAYRDGSPLKLAQTETVSVNVRALYASSKDSYEVEWTETTFDLKGEQIGTQNYKGVITISIHPPEDEGLARVNPLGIYVTNVSWSKVL